jgi:hypothetical protein
LQTGSLLLRKFDKEGSMAETGIIPTQAEAEEHRQHKRELDRQRGISSRKGRPKGSRHGFNRVLATVKLLGLDGIDRRTAAARSLLQWRSQLAADLGGLEGLSAQRLALIDLACRTKALVDHADAYLLSLGSVVNKRRRALFPIVMQRQTLAESLARMLNQLGLDRVEKRVSMTEYLVSKKEPKSEPEPEE